MATAKQVVAALIVRDDRILICQRMPDQTMPLKWEFPGGKVEPEEGLPAALRRELDEELGITATIGTRVAVIHHSYGSGNAVELHFYRVDYFEGEIQNRIFHDVRWVIRKELPTYDFLAADVAFVKKISAGEVL
ncbi:MAG TPA: (deoxy)nucleoside triphosphate pyrophosphohydrolase [Candidatus Angelobacter sp.]|nr:(deoxy)nucleoside triphosphate pyrophosphohydrolase [Candidatus Angelobacter sp.]